MKKGFVIPDVEICEMSAEGVMSGALAISADGREAIIFIDDSVTTKGYNTWKENQQ